MMLVDTSVTSTIATDDDEVGTLLGASAGVANIRGPVLTNSIVYDVLDRAKTFPEVGG